jgi:MFS family permease
MAETPRPIGRRYAAFGYRDFVLFEGSRFLATFAIQMQAVAVGYQVYELTRRPLDLGYAGLAQFLPSVVLSLYAGDVVDRFERRRIVALTHAGFAACSLMLCATALRPSLGLQAIYSSLVLYGIVRAFAGPANQAILPDIVPERDFANAVAWAESIWQGAAILGPAAGGILYAAVGGARTYAIAAVCSITALALTATMRVRVLRPAQEGHTVDRVLAGVRYLWANKVILGAISLDLFAVLLGGATALLPVYARDILRVGATGLGVLRSAPSVGGSLMALVLAFRPLARRAGPVMLAGVAVFGVATIVFGASRNFALSLVALFTLGAADMISVVVRHTLVQLRTPAEMRGRVSAVNTVFIGASNQLGEFESGVTASWWGTVPAVIVGGIGTLVVVSLWVVVFPALKRVDRLVERERE